MADGAGAGRGCHGDLRDRPFASPVAAFEVTDCRLIVQSFDGDGEPLDTAVGDTGGGEGGTRADPFRVDYEGTVLYEGDTGEHVITDQAWSVDVFLIPDPASR